MGKSKAYIVMTLVIVAILMISSVAYSGPKKPPPPPPPPPPVFAPFTLCVLTNFFVPEVLIANIGTLQSLNNNISDSGSCSEYEIIKIAIARE